MIHNFLQHLEKQQDHKQHYNYQNKINYLIYHYIQMMMIYKKIQKIKMYIIIQK